MNKKDKASTPLESLGKILLLERYFSLFAKNKTEKAISLHEDAAVLTVQKKNILSTLKIFTEGVHFNLVYFPLKHLGFKTVVASITDIYAMNAAPVEISMNLAVSNKFSLEHLDEFFGGVLMACEKYDISLSKLDIGPSITGLVIAIEAIGQADGEIVRQSGARTTDLICVTGNFGAAYMGLQVLERERKVFESTGGAQPILESYKYIIERQLKPEARKEIIQLLGKVSLTPTSMTSVSEGLAYSILSLCKASGTGCKIFAEKIPVDAETDTAATEMNLEPLTCALNGGEDYELLFTIALSDFDKISAHPEIRVIGHMIEAKEKALIFESGSTVPLRAQGWLE